MYRLRPACVVALALACCLEAYAAVPRSSRLERLWTEFSESLDGLAIEYGRIGRTADAERLRSDLELGLNAMSNAPPERPLVIDAAALPGPVATAWTRERSLRKDYADDVYRLARAQFLDGETSNGMSLLRHALAIDPDNELVRRMLGYELSRGSWKTVFELQMEREGRVWHDRFGWIRSDHVARYEAGERYFRNRWMTAGEEAAFRRNFEYAWEAETENFVVKTNVSLEVAAALAKRLETFHTYFYREFSPLFDSRAAAREFLKPAARRARHKHEVHYYATREEYVRRLTPKQQGVAISRGVYLPRDRVSYFFDDPEQTDPYDTLYHEVTHQLLFESDPRMRDVAESGGYWAVEGLACYFESFRPPDEAEQLGRPIAGDIDHDRMRWARYRVLVEGYFVSMQQFDRLGMKLYQSARSEDELRRRYSQSTGFSHFLLHYDDGRYRDGFLEYISRLYAPRSPRRPTLESILGVPYSMLDRQYRDYMALLDQEAAIPTVSMQPVSE